MKYMVVIEEGATSWGAYVPDLPGCIAAGETRDEVVELIHEAIEFHLEGLKEDGESLPSPHSSSELVEVTAA
ncbi:MAG: type II toxin-antitoxin system HicB family antitoxin [Salinisphaera sp.]|nr:type II toxin-antitoxin system HicB family antitoxin [Salinisphaera sp.]